MFLPLAQVGLKGALSYIVPCFLAQKVYLVGSPMIPVTHPHTCSHGSSSLQLRAEGKQTGQPRLGVPQNPFMLLLRSRAGPSPPPTNLVLISKSSWLEWHISLNRDTKKS
jgi:hypothetical protein